MTQITKVRQRRTRPITQLIQDVIKAEGRPLQLHEIIDLVDKTEKYNASLYIRSISVLLNREVKTGGLTRIKKPFTYLFFGLPDWERDEKDTIVNSSIYDPQTKVFKRKQETNWDYWKQEYIKQPERVALGGGELLPTEEKVFDFLSEKVKL